MTSSMQENIPVIETILEREIDPSLLILPLNDTSTEHPVQINVKEHEIGIAYRSLNEFFFLTPGTYKSKTRQVSELRVKFLRLDPVFLEWKIPLEAGVHVTRHVTVGIKGSMLFSIKEYDLFFTNVIKKIGFENERIIDWINHGIKNILVALLPPLTKNNSAFPTEDELTSLLKTSLEEFMVIFGIEVTSLQVTGFEVPESLQLTEETREEHATESREGEGTQEIKNEISSEVFWERIKDNLLVEIYAPKIITTGVKSVLEIELRSLLPNPIDMLQVIVESPGMLFETPSRMIQSSKSIISLSFSMVPYKYGEIPLRVKIVNNETNRTITQFESSIYVRSNAAMLAMRNTGFAVIFMGSILLGLATFISLYLGEPITFPKTSFSWIQAITLSGIITVIIGLIPSVIGSVVMHQRRKNDILVALATKKY